MKLKILAVILTGMFVPGVNAQKMTPVATVGKWQIRSHKDPMTDKIGCTAFYNGRDDVQLNHESFYISLRGRGGIKHFTTRFDDKPANEPQLPSKTHQRIGVVGFETSDLEFHELQKSKRVRVQVYTVLRDVVFEDIDLTSVGSVMQTLTSAKCGK